MFRIIAAFLSASTTALAATDYRDIAALVGPCAKALALTVKTGDLEMATNGARTLCRDKAGEACPDLWLVYAFGATKLQADDAMAASDAAVRHLPDSAAAHFIRARAYAVSGGSGGLLDTIRVMKIARQCLEETLRIDPDCHQARGILVNLYGVPKLAGGDPNKVQAHLRELERRDNYFASLAHGDIEIHRKSFSAAMDYYQKALALSPMEQEPRKGLIKAAKGVGDFEAAFGECAKLHPEFPGDGSTEAIFIQLSMESGLHENEALEASTRFLSAAKGVTPLQRAHVEVNTALILKFTGRDREAAKLVAAAEERWEGARALFRKTEKLYRRQIESRPEQ